MIDRPSDMLTLTLPDGATRDVAPGTLPGEVVRSIGERLLQAAVAVEVNGEVQDLMTPLRESGTFRVLTARDARALDVLRHSAAHLLATAVRRAASRREDRLRPGHRRRLLLRLRGRARRSPPRTSVRFEDEMAQGGAREAAVRARRGLAPRGRAGLRRRPAQARAPERTGGRTRSSRPTPTDRSSTCAAARTCPTRRTSSTSSCCTRRAPTGAATSTVRCCSASTATAFFKKEELDAHLHRIEEAKRRDHRVLGKQLDLFLFHQFSPGAPFWTERGTTIYNALGGLRPRAAARRLPRNARRRCSTTRGCGRSRDTGASTARTCSSCSTPRRSEHDMSLKPMNCPSHYLLYLAKKHSYRELPLRLRDVRRAAPQRGDRRALRAHARAPVPAGRLPRLPDARTRSPTRCSFLAGLHPRLLRDVRPHGDAAVRDAPRDAHRHRRAVGPRRGRAAGGARSDRACRTS